MLRKLFILLILFCGLSQAQVNNSVEQIDKPKSEKLIRERNGKVLLLNLWATWCVPCREEFPDLVRLSEGYKNLNLEIVGISIDFGEDLKTKVIPFLKKLKANFVNYISAFRNDEELINLINEKWNGALPATVIYNTKGEQVIFWEGKKSFNEFETKIREVIKNQ